MALLKNAQVEGFWMSDLERMTCKCLRKTNKLKDKTTTQTTRTNAPHTHTHKINSRHKENIKKTYKSRRLKLLSDF